MRIGWLQKISNAINKGRSWWNRNGGKVNRIVTAGANAAHGLADAMGGRGGQNLHNLANGVTRFQGQANNVLNRVAR